MRPARRLPTAAALLVVLGALLLAFAQRVDAQETDDTPEGGFVDVIKVDGLIDPIMASFIERSIDQAERDDARWLVLQANTTGAVVSDGELNALIVKMRDADVPIAVWVGPSGSALTHEAALLRSGADEFGMAPGTRFGDLPDDQPIRFMEAPPPSCETSCIDATWPPPLYGDAVNEEEAAELGITTRDAPTIGDFILNLPGVESREVTADDGETRREPVTIVRFGQLSLVDQLMHTVASAAVAYLLLAVGLGLIVFELFTAGVGVAGVIGAGSLVLSCYGLAVLPTNWWGIALIGFSFIAFAVDVQTGVPRFWTGVGVVSFVAGSLTLYDGLSLSWITLTVGIAGVLLAFLAGMPPMVRARFSTPTIGRDWMVGEMGRAVTAISPDGVVQVREALWRAYTNRATPIDELDRVRVVGIEGLVLEVEPEEGGARDYRERRRTSAGDSGE
jgi:membrane-bound serine protease (ClpP class)